VTSRYARQEILPPIGPEGQAAIRAAHVLVAGAGALGTVIIDQLARAGVGTITIVDRDVVDVTNLQRQTLYDERDAARGTPKVEAAKARIAAINGDVRVRAFWDDLGARNAERYAAGAQVIVDGLDNLESRYLLNDVSVKLGVPYVYGGAVATGGMFAVLRPGLTACLRCIAPEPPPPGTIATCDVHGVLGMATATIASLEAAETLKLLVGATAAVERGLVAIDLWRNEWRRTDLSNARDPACPACAGRRFEFLDGDRLPNVTALCGKNAVQIVPRLAISCDLAALAARLAPHAHVTETAVSVTAGFPDSGLAMEVFDDGRTVVSGTTDVEAARTLAARFVGV
jgi:molybdopterin/thiamine biosynthesis adenylyltransferase